MDWVLDGIGRFFTSLWTAMRDFGVQFWGVIVIVAMLAWQGFTLIGDMTIKAAQAMLGLANWGAAAGSQGIQDGTLSQYFAVANTIYPLDETVRLMAALVVGVWLPLGLYRAIKSWLPAGFAGGS
jgi:hypothetical protein